MQAVAGLSLEQQLVQSIAFEKTGALIPMRVPFEKYIEMPGLHATALTDMVTSPLLYKQRRAKPLPDKDTFRVGRATHTAILEPDYFALEYTVCKMPRRAGAKWEAFAEANADKTILTQAQYATALACRDAVRNHKVAKRYLSRGGKSEVTITWKHASGEVCKSRLDLLCKDVIVDVKSTRDPSPRRFGNDAARFLYPMKMSFYQDAAFAAGLGRLPVVIIAVQNVEPFDVVVYILGEEILNLGRIQYEAAIARVIECRRNNSWPGVAPDAEQELELPSWLTASGDDELTMDGESLF